MTGPDLPDDRKAEPPQEHSFFSRPPRPLERHEPLALPDDDDVFEEEEEPRSIFSATWFRVVVVVVVLGVVAAVAGPYVLDTVSPPPIGGRASIESARTSNPDAPAQQPAAGTVTPAVTQSTDQPPIAAATSNGAQASTESKPPATATPPTTSAMAPTPAKDTPAKDESAAKPAPAATSETATPRLAQPAPAPVRPAAGSKVVARATDTAKAAASRRATDDGARATTAKDGVGGDFWVQVGAFKNADTAKRVAARLRQQHYPVQEFVTGAEQGAVAATSDSVDQYLVVVEGATPAQVAAKLASPELKAEARGSSVIVRPALALRQAVELSRALEADGLRVQVRRTSRDAVAAASGDTLHRVRVGGFRDRAAAVAASRQLTEKGYQTYVARGNE